MTMATTTFEPEPFADDELPKGRRNAGMGMTALVLASLGIAGLALYRDAGVRAAVRTVATDTRVRAASGDLKNAIAAAWREHGGPAAMADAVRRGSRLVRTP